MKIVNRSGASSQELCCHQPAKENSKVQITVFWFFHLEIHLWEHRWFKRIRSTSAVSITAEAFDRFGRVRLLRLQARLYLQNPLMEMTSGLSLLSLFVHFLPPCLSWRGQRTRPMCICHRSTPVSSSSPRLINNVHTNQLPCVHYHRRGCFCESQSGKNINF